MLSLQQVEVFSVVTVDELLARTASEVVDEYKLLERTAADLAKFQMMLQLYDFMYYVARDVFNAPESLQLNRSIASVIEFEAGMATVIHRVLLRDHFSYYIAAARFPVNVAGSAKARRSSDLSSYFVKRTRGDCTFRKRFIARGEWAFHEQGFHLLACLQVNWSAHIPTLFPGESIVPEEPIVVKGIDWLTQLSPFIQKYQTSEDGRR